MKTLSRFYVMIALASFCSPALPAQTQLPAGVSTQQMQVLGDEGKQLEASCGEWEVTFTLWPSPGAEPTVVKGLLADRKMVGSYQAETMKPSPGAKVPDFTRLAYLTFNRVEGRWQYVSLDTRFPVGIMPAHSFGRSKTGESTKLEFDPIGFPGMGKEVEGKMLRSDLVIDRQSNDQEIFQQHFISSDGTEREWLAIQYEYRRRK